MYVVLLLCSFAVALFAALRAAPFWKGRVERRPAIQFKGLRRVEQGADALKRLNLRAYHRLTLPSSD